MVREFLGALVCKVNGHKLVHDKTSFQREMTKTTSIPFITIKRVHYKCSRCGHYETKIVRIIDVEPQNIGKRAQ